jgi:hypothetical protein
MKHTVLILLLLVAVAAGAATAAEITLTTGQKDYYFILGDPALVPVEVTNTYDRDIPGMLESTVTESTTAPGLSLSSSSSNAHSYTAMKGSSGVTIDGGSSDVEKTVRISFSFDYNDPDPKRQDLGEITIHFVKDASQVRNAPERVVSRSGTPGQGAAGTSLLSQQDEVLQQMMQQSATMGFSFGFPQSSDNSQMAQDTSALKQQPQQEQEKGQADQEEFSQNLEQDQTVRAVDQSLKDQGYSPTRTDTSPESGKQGSFSRSYTNPAGDTVMVQGRLENGSAREVTESTTAGVSPPGPLSQNQTYQESARDLEQQGYSHSSTTIRNTPSGSVVNQTYQGPQGAQVYLNATDTQTNVTSVSVTKEEKQVDYLIPAAIIILAAVLVIAGYILWKRPKKAHPVVVEKPPVAHAPPGDYRKEALELLARAGRAHAAGNTREAFGTAGQALRFCLSSRYGNGSEMTGAEVLALLEGSGRHRPDIEEVLGRCSLIEFAKAGEEPGEFERFRETIREIIREA